MSVREVLAGFVEEVSSKCEIITSENKRVFDDRERKTAEAAREFEDLLRELQLSRVPGSQAGGKPYTDWDEREREKQADRERQRQRRFPRQTPHSASPQGPVSEARIGNTPPLYQARPTPARGTRGHVQQHVITPAHPRGMLGTPSASTQATPAKPTLGDSPPIPPQALDLEPAPPAPPAPLAPLALPLPSDVSRRLSDGEWVGGRGGGQSAAAFVRSASVDSVNSSGGVEPESPLDFYLHRRNTPNFSAPVPDAPGSSYADTPLLLPRADSVLPRADSVPLQRADNVPQSQWGPTDAEIREAMDAILAIGVEPDEVIEIVLENPKYFVKWRQDEEWVHGGMEKVQRRMHALFNVQHTFVT